MSDPLSIGSSAVRAYQTALTTVANNVANMNTAGYSREQVTLKAVDSQADGTRFLGAGVLVSAVQRAWDQLSQTNVLGSNSSLATQTPMVKYANQVVDLLGNSQGNLSSSLDGFFTAAQSLSATPSDSALRGQYLTGAQSLAASFRSLAGQMSTVEQASRGEMQTGITTFNSLAAQLALVNGQLSTKLSTADQPPTLLDQRDQLLSQMSQLAGITVAYQGNGEVDVGIGASATQATVVSGTTAHTIGAIFSDTAAGKVDFQIDPTGNPTPLTSLSSGSLAGIAAFRQQVLEPAQSGLDTLATTIASTVNRIQAAGIDAYGNAGEPLFNFVAPDGSAASASAATIAVALSDPQKIAASALFRGTASTSNLSSAQATVKWTSPAGTPAGPPTLDRVVQNNGASNPQTDPAVNASGRLQALATIPAGYSGTTLSLQTTPASGANLYVFTREGTQLAGPALSATDQAALLANPANGFAAGTSAIQDITSGSTSQYLGLGAFYGAQADPTGTPASATLAGTPVPTGSGAGTISAGAITINGQTLPALASTSPQGPGADALATWLRTGLQNASPPVTVQASNTLRLDSSQIQLSSTVPFSINGTTITPPLTGYRTLDDLANSINGISASTGVAASVGADGSLSLSSTLDPMQGSDSTGRDFSLGNPTYSSQPSPLGIAIPSAGMLVRGDLTLQSTATIQATGAASDLARLGLRAQVRLSGSAPQDLLVFAGAPASGTGTGTLAASYATGTLDAEASLRAEPLSIHFTSSTDYSITDQKTGTLLATRSGYDASKGIQYEGLQITLSSAPATGDTFSIDGNQDGVGDNSNMLAVVALQTDRSVMPNNQTLNDAYNGIVSSAGQVSNQATIAQQALTVVNQQAIQAADQVSGVNMNNEASDLIRFQQAYQAAAKTIDVANQLFDTIDQLHV